MLILPKLEVIRDKYAEAKLVERTIDWLAKEGEGRDKRVHASDLLDPRKAYWNAQHKETVTPRMAGNFMVGKVLHAFFGTALTKQKGLSLKETDVGGTWDKELGISYANDFDIDGNPGELKTSRTINEQSTKDLSAYLEQLCIYMAAKKKLRGWLAVLRLMAKDIKQGWGSYPQYRIYEIQWSKTALAQYRKQIKSVAILLTKALKLKKPKLLPLCREWKCGENNCGHWSLCKPEGRFGVKKWAK